MKIVERKNETKTKDQKTTEKNKHNESKTTRKQTERNIGWTSRLTTLVGICNLSFRYLSTPSNLLVALTYLAVDMYIL